MNDQGDYGVPSIQICEKRSAITHPSIRPLIVLFLILIAVSVIGLHISLEVEAEEEDPYSSPLDEWVFRPPQHVTSEVVTREYSYLRSPSMEVGPDGTVHAIWLEHLGEGKAEIRYSRSIDGGTTWTKSIALSPFSTRTVQFPDLVIDDVGAIHVSWIEDRLGEPVVLVIRSTDGGLTFSEPWQMGNLVNFPYLLRARLAVSTEGTVYAACLNAATRVYRDHHDGTYEYYYEDLAVGWSMSVNGGAWEDQRLVLDLDTEAHIYNYNDAGPPVAIDDDGNLHIATSDYSNKVYASVVNTSSHAVKSRSIPKRTWSSIDEDLEVVVHGNQVGVLFIEQEGPGTWLHHEWYNVSSGGVIQQETILYQSSGSSVHRCHLHDAAVSPDGTLHVLTGGTYEGVLYLLTMDLADLQSLTRHEYLEERHDVFGGGSFTPLDEGWDSLLISGGVSKYLPYEYDYGWSRDDLECLRWNRSMGIIGIPVLIGRDVDYLPDRTGLKVAHGVDGSVLSVWREGRSSGGIIYFSSRTNGSNGFSQPVELSNQSEHAYAYGQPDLVVDENGSIHVVWFEHHISWEAIPTVIMYTISHDNGTTWSRPTYAAFSVYDDSLCIAASPNGEVFLAYQSAWMIEDQIHYTIHVVRWEGELGNLTRLRYVAAVPKDGPYGRGFIRDIDLKVSPEGNPHMICTYKDPTSNETPRFLWLRSTDGGDTWNVARFLAMDYDLSNDASSRLAVVDDEHIYLAFTVSHNDTSPPRVALRLAKVDINHGFISETMLYQGSWGIRPLAGAMAIETIPEGEAVVSVLVLKAEVGAHPLESSTISLMAFSTAPLGRINGPLAIMTGLEDVVLDPGKIMRVLDQVTLDLSMDPWGAPTVAGVLIDDQWGHLGTYVWGVNHLPEITNISMAGGEWVLGNTADLEVEPTIDPDGDILEYRFRIWKDDLTLNITSDWSSNTRWTVPNLGHGDHHWSVEIRDGFEETTPSEGWWLRMDTGPPTADAGGPYEVTEGKSITIDGGNSQDDGALVEWEWDLGDDGVFEHSSTTPSFMFTGADDLLTVITLRVTDEAGRQAIAKTELVVLNSPPTCALSGHEDLTAGDIGHLRLTVMDDGKLDTHSIIWSSEAEPLGEGPIISIELLTPGTFVLTVEVVDDDGGMCTEEFVLTIDYKDLSIKLFHPTEVWAGDGFKMFITDNYDEPLETLNVSWFVDGAAVGTGRELLWTATLAGTHEVRVDAVDPVGHEAMATGEIQVRGRLTPVLLVGTIAITNSSVTIEWTVCEQAVAFERYSIVISTQPISSPPTSHSGDEWDIDHENETWVDVIGRTDTTCSFEGLEPDATYYIRVDVIGDDQRSHSNVISFSTQQDAPAEDTGDPNAWDPYVSGSIIVGIIVGIIAVTVASLIVRRQRADGP